MSSYAAGLESKAMLQQEDASMDMDTGVEQSENVPEEQKEQPKFEIDVRYWTWTDLTEGLLEDQVSPIYLL